jgi:ferredoxin-type protein NapH
MGCTMSSTAAKLNWKRRLVQVVSLGLLGEFAFYGVFRCPFAVPYVGCGSCPVMQCPGRKWYLPIWGAILASALLFGRAFCGWACPGGLVSNLLGTMAPVRSRVRGVAGRALRSGKYIVLAAALAAWLIWNNPRLAVPIRTGDFFQSVGLTFEHAGWLWFWRSMIVVAAIVAGMVVSHAWCRFLCPTGGILELFNRFALLRYRKTAECNDCGACEPACVMGTRPDEVNCTNCGDCASKCPMDAIRLARVSRAPAASARPGCGGTVSLIEPSAGATSRPGNRSKNGE